MSYSIRPTDYCCVDQITDDLVSIRSTQFGLQLWVRVRKLRTRTVCHNCCRQVESGWRPLTNHANRWHRLCIGCATPVTTDAQAIDITR